MNTRNHEVVLSSPGADVNAVHDLLETVWLDSPEIGMLDRFAVETALIELAGNVLEHADEGQGVSCAISIEVCRGRLEAVLRDTGRPAAIRLHDAAMPDPLAEGGRGLPLVRALVEELTYERQGSVNQWRISKALGRVPDAG